MDRLQHQLQESVEKMMTDIDKSRMRAMNQRAYTDMAKCFDERTYNQDQVESCLKGGSAKIKATEALVKNQLNQLQNRIQRCSAACEDETRDQVPLAFSSTATQASKDEANKKMYACASSCVEKHIALIKGIQATIEREIDSLK